MELKVMSINGGLLSTTPFPMILFLFSHLLFPKIYKCLFKETMKISWNR